MTPAPSPTQWLYRKPYYFATPWQGVCLAIAIGINALVPTYAAEDKKNTTRALPQHYEAVPTIGTTEALDQLEMYLGKTPSEQKDTIGEEVTIERFRDPPTEVIGIGKSALGEEIPQAQGKGASSTPLKQAGRFEFAISTPTANNSMQLLLDQGFQALQLGQYEAAITLYKQAAAINRTHEEVLFGLATAYHRSHRLEQAKNYYSALLDSYPEHKEGSHNYMLLLSDIAPLAMLKRLQTIENEQPSNSSVIAQIAHIYLRLHNLDQARSYFRKAITLAPQEVSYRYNLAVVLDKLGQHHSAIPLYKQVLSEAALREEFSPEMLQSIEKRVAFLRFQ